MRRKTVKITVGSNFKKFAAEGLIWTTAGRRTKFHSRDTSILFLKINNNSILFINIYYNHFLLKKKKKKGYILQEQIFSYKKRKGVRLISHEWIKEMS